MFYRRAGIRHTTYREERQLWPLPFDRFLVGLVAALLIVAPFVVDRLYLVAYLLPWLIWSSAALGLNLLMGGAGQIHLGYGAVMAIGAYTSVHLVRFGTPFELAMLGGGLASAAIGSIFGFAALRVKSLYLAMATIAMQYIVDFVITHVPGISGGGMASLEVPPVRFLGILIEGDLPTYFMALAVCAVVALFMLNVGRTAFGRALAAVREKDYAAEIIGIDTFKYKLLGVLVEFVHRRRDRGRAGGVLSAQRLAGAVQSRSVDPASRHGDRRRARQRARLLLRRRAYSVRAHRL